MSVFRGSIIECPSIIVDHFTPNNCQRGRAFFLSHCHRDHMTGLDSSDLLFALTSKNTHLYCSEVTKGLLSGDGRFTRLIPLMKSLPIEEPVTIKLIPTQEDNCMNITVTLLPAGHCPGSVMFLFHLDTCNVLYTGDFRLSLSELRNMDCLHNHTTPIDINTLYLDTTFCHNQANDIISREKTREFILELIETWLSADSSNAVYLDCPSFGYEHIFLTISAHFKTKIHISPWRMKSYSVLPEVQQSLTLNGEETRIHSCGFKKRLKTTGLPCRCLSTKGTQVIKVLRIKPSTQWFVTSHGRLSHPKVFMKSINMARVLHSMHASYNELRQFVSYLSPCSIVPCVIPYSLGDKSIVDLHDRIRKLLPHKSVINTVPINNEETEKLTVKRKDPIYEGDDDSNNDSNGSDYDTDDEYACIDDWDDIVSPDHVSHDKSGENSFDLSLPAFCSHGDVAVEKKGKQPLIDLSFDDTDGSYGETTYQVERRHDNESTDDNNNSYLLPVIKKDCEEEKELLPKVKRRKTIDIEYSLSDGANSSDQLSSSIQPPITIIDLTQTSSSSSSSNSSFLSSRESMTPDSVIFTGITIDYYESYNESSNEIPYSDTGDRERVTPPPISVKSVTPPPISLTDTTPSPVSPHLRENSVTPPPISVKRVTPSPISLIGTTPSPVSPHLRETSSPSLLLPTPEKSIRSIELLGKKRAFEFI